MNNYKVNCVTLTITINLLGMAMERITHFQNSIKMNEVTMLPRNDNKLHLLYPERVRLSQYLSEAIFKTMFHEKKHVSSQLYKYKCLLH